MTMQRLKSLTDWNRTLQRRSIWCDLADGQTARVVGVGRVWVRLMAAGGAKSKVRPESIVEIRGL